MEKIRIQKGIPIPLVTEYSRSKGRIKWPFRELEVGDSFVIKRGLHRSDQCINAILQYWNGKRNDSSPDFAKEGRHFTKRTTAKEYRIWRDR